ncbi:hypothetical protein GOV11_01185 [Candidatus Woesearchaeota archaeon]|nr:hypothetical protein [Candidatus Woesearchaeota archaeon]
MYHKKDSDDLPDFLPGFIPYWQEQQQRKEERPFLQIQIEAPPTTKKDDYSVPDYEVPGSSVEYTI